MLKTLWFAIFLALLCVNQLHAQQQVSIPTEEGSFKAGDRYNIDGVLARPSTQSWLATVRYSSKADNPAAPETTFDCSGRIEPGNQKFQLLCVPDRQLPGGVYRTDNKILLDRIETGEQQTLSVRAPILTIIANPFDASDVPQVVSLALSFNQRQALENGSIAAHNLLDSLNKYFPKEVPDTAQNRAYLRTQAERARTILDFTRRRYIDGTPNDVTPIFFQDFDRQLSQIIRDLGGTPVAEAAAGKRYGVPHLVLAQMPQTRESVDAKDSSGKQNKLAVALTNLIESIDKGFEKIAKSGLKQFTFSIETIPVGATLYIQRMGEREIAWQGVTNFKDQNLEYALWTFRIDWGGCSRIEMPNPYLQSVIDIKISRSGCQSK